jgi:hypothetical protein
MTGNLKENLFRPRNFVFLVAVLIAGWIGQFVYSTNNICSGDEHLIESEADAIEVAKNRLIKDPFFSSEEFGSALDFLNALLQTRNCCEVIKRRALFLFIVWDVYLFAETPTKRLSAMMGLSNCGRIAAETKFKAIEPR